MKIYPACSVATPVCRGTSETIGPNSLLEHFHCRSIRSYGAFAKKCPNLRLTADPSRSDYILKPWQK